MMHRGLRISCIIASLLIFATMALVMSYSVGAAAKTRTDSRKEFELQSPSDATC